ncbi:MAG TPA: PSD1 and planctomycete cytochrome C domain-containing protein [Pirellulales bacterium]|nr:PSD1 and planctomycete cytochrome C domain-containing protein [Pirellulales bacterium]
MRRLLRGLFVAGILGFCIGNFSVAESAAPAVSSATASPAAAKPVDFNRDVVPILSNNCFKCHGPDGAQRKARLRLDVGEVATKPAESGSIAIVPGKPDKSELVERIFSSDDDERMPPPKSNKHLSDAQRQVLKQWIAQGAVYKRHWAYVAPERPAVPLAIAAPAGDPPANPIDAFVLAKLKEQHLKPSAQADRVTLVRRLYFDLTGLPPSPAQVAEFVDDRDPRAYEKLIDRLLASPHYGERMAMYWLDLVRYGDSCGYHSDNARDVYLYRDYVIAAFNSDKPFDRFTTEQLAGDLLSDASNETRIASGYNRLLLTTEEGGAQAKEYTAKYAADRVRNLASVWLGSTMACCECHDHKFDPFKTRDFYSMEAFFADVKENAISRQEETPMPSAEQAVELKRLEDERATAARHLDEQTPALDAAQAEWEKTATRDTVAWTPLHPASATAKSGATLKILDDNSILAGGKMPDRETYTIIADLDRGGAAGINGIRLEAMADPSMPAHGPGRASNGNFVLSEIALAAAQQSSHEKASPIALAHASADFSQSGFNIEKSIDGNLGTGWAILPEVGKTHSAIFETASPIREVGKDDKAGVQLQFVLQFHFGAAHSIGRLRLSTTTHAPPLAVGKGLPADIAKLLDIAAAKRTAAQRQSVSAYFRSIAPELRSARAKVAELNRKKAELEKSFAKTLITTSVAPRSVRILPRGNWQDDSGEIVSPAVPEFLLPLEIKDRRPNRLDLARWLVDRRNPLVARVFVNRIWMLLFGQGIVKTSEDFGSQGAAPSHPALLDWLATDFVASGWDVKHIVKLVAMSNTYRQASVASPELQQIDPDNRWLARQGCFRLDAEFVRDDALAISGLLSPKIGGPSVKPYQPAGYWAYLNFPTRDWQADRGENQYRRGLYTWWQRTFLHPSLKAFDAPTREECTASRTRSNTPLQSLVLLNDPTYVEAARVFAAEIVGQGGSQAAERIDWAFHRALSRPATADENRILLELYTKHHAEYIADAAAAKKLLGVGDAAPPAGVDPAELAAWTSVARVILNLHETITRS